MARFLHPVTNKNKRKASYGKRNRARSKVDFHMGANACSSSMDKSGEKEKKIKNEKHIGNFQVVGMYIMDKDFFRPPRLRLGKLVTYDNFCLSDSCGTRCASSISSWIACCLASINFLAPTRSSWMRQDTSHPRLVRQQACFV